jgi:hypothetical protein
MPSIKPFPLLLFPGRCVVALLLATVVSAVAQAATIQVVSTYNNDGCRLRDAITAANTDTNVGQCTRIGSGSADILMLPPLFIPGHPGNGVGDYNNEDANVRGDYDITSDITIQGIDPTQSSIASMPLDRLFDVHTGAVLTLRDMTVFGGSVITSSVPQGGMLRKAAGSTVTLERVLVYGGTADRGGAIFANVQTGALTLSSTTVRSGYAVTSGGAIDLFTGLSSAVTTTLTNVTLSGNAAGTKSALAATGTPLVLRNVTIARNQTFSTSRAVELSSLDDSEVSFTNVLLLDNNSSSNNQANLRCFASAAIGTMRHTVVGGSTVGCPVTTTVGTPATKDVRLMPLFDYGGGIPTHALELGSIAIGNGSPVGANGCPTTDARGITRTNPCEIGAYEHRIDLTVNSTADLPDSTPGDGLCRASNNACTLRAATMEAGAAGGRWIVGLPAGTYTLSQSPVFNSDPSGGDLDIEAAEDDTPPLVFHLFGLGTPANTHLVGSGSDRVLQARGTFYNESDDEFFDRWLSFAMSNVTVRDGYLTDDIYRSQYESLAGGGVMLSSGNTLLYNVVVRDNEVRPATGGGGGGGVGIWVPRYGFNQHPQSQSARLERFALLDNLVEAATFTQPDGSITFGGGLFSSGPDLERNDDAIALVNGVVAGNRADLIGGLYLIQKGFVSFVTVTENVGRQHARDQLPRTGGISFAGSQNRVTNSIIAGNLYGTTPNDCSTALGVSSALNSLGYLLIGNADGCVISGDLTGNVIGAAALLGPRETAADGMVFYRPRVASPAYLAVPPADCVDDRGFAVPRDIKGDVRPEPASNCSMGAAEGAAFEIGIFANGFEGS